MLYVANRNEGSVSVISFRSRKVIHKWHIPGGGSPDMGDVSANGKVLWLSGRYNSVVYAIDTRTGRLIARIPGRREPSRALRVAAAGQILPRPHREHALMRTLWLRPRVDLFGPAAPAGLLAALLVWLGPPGTDLAAHVYQRTLFIQHGFVLWNNFWYAGRYSFVNYSVLYYPLAAAIGIKLLAVLTVTVAVVAFAAVVRHEWELHSRWTIRAFALVWALLVVSAAYPFMLGMALACSPSGRCNTTAAGCSRASHS